LDAIVSDVGRTRISPQAGREEKESSLHVSEGKNGPIFFALFSFCDVVARKIPSLLVCFFIYFDFPVSNVFVLPFLSWKNVPFS
jgi:hypothetical protein